MCRTFNTLTAYSITLTQLRSVCITMLPTLRCTKTSPGNNPLIWLAGTRLSEQPIHRYSGCCCLASRAKNSGSSSDTRFAQALLFVQQTVQIPSHTNPLFCRVTQVASGAVYCLLTQIRWTFAHYTAASAEFVFVEAFPK